MKTPCRPGPCPPRWLWLGLAVALAGRANAAAAAPEESALGLDEAIRLALSQNPPSQEARARVAGAAGRAAQAGRWANPELELAAEDWPTGAGYGFQDAKRTIGLVQTLPFPGRKPAERRVGRADLDVSRAALDVYRADLAREVTLAFHRAVAADRVDAVATELVGVAESSAATAAKRVQAGATPYQEQLRAEIQLEQARTELRKAAQERSSARRTLATLLGQPEREAAALRDALADEADPTLLDAADLARLEAHPRLRQARLELERAQLVARRTRLDPFPDVKLGLAGGQASDPDRSIVELRFSMPLPILDRARGRRIEAEADVDAALARLHASRLELAAALANARERYRTAADAADAFRQRVLPKATEALRLVQRGFEEGRFAFMDLIDTQRTAAETRLAYQQRLLDLRIAQAELQALVQPLPSALNPVP